MYNYCIKKCFIFLSLFLVLSFNSCDKKGNQTLIKGNYTNLPDGMMYLCQDNDLNKIDSVKTIKGKFNFKYTIKDKKNEPIYFSLHHIDRKGTFRFISFSTDAKYRNGKWYSSTFLSDSIITLEGKLTEINPVGVNFGAGSIFTEAPKLKAGYQTNAMYHIDGDLFENINNNTYKKIELAIKEYPNSFHLLYKINGTRNSFTPEQLGIFLKLFKGEIVDSETFQNLKTYNEKRFSKKKIEMPLLKDDSGKNTIVLDKKFKKHLIIFWASWCGPCRQEIPSLKKMFLKYNDSIEFVSISTDNENSQWQKALKKEQMPWKQLILDQKSKEYETIEILFQLSNSIPYVALVDNKSNVIKSHEGLMTETELENLLKE